jgi:hypothetical protein
VTAWLASATGLVPYVDCVDCKGADIMPTKFTVIHDNPTDPAAFERIETSKVWPKEYGTFADIEES